MVDGDFAGFQCPGRGDGGWNAFDPLAGQRGAVDGLFYLQGLQPARIAEPRIGMLSG